MRIPRVSRRQLLVVSAALATVAAGLPVMLSSSASAAATGDITLTGPTHGAAGSCLAYSVTPTDAFGRVANDTGTVVIRLTENPANDTSQDVDFCKPGTVSTPTVAPHYVNANGARQTYTAGPTITSTVTTSPASSPDVASPTTPAAQANPTGKDTAVYVYDGRAGASTTLTFGVAGLVAGGATLDVFRSADGDEVQSAGDPSRTLNVTFTAGGLPGSTQAADAVSTAALSPKTSYAPTGGAAHAFTAQLTNASGDGVSGVMPQIQATAGPNAPTTTTAGTFTASCGISDNSGASACTYKGTKSGTDTVTVWVDQTVARTPRPTAGLDANEPRDTASAVTTVAASQAKVIGLAPKGTSMTGGTTKAFTATVTDINGTPATGVAVSFTETGPGSLQGGTVGSGTTTTTLNATTDASGRATATLVTAATDSGASTMTAAIRNPASTLCQSSGGRCTDTATTTVTSASPTPTPSSSTPGCVTAATLLGSPLISAMDTDIVTVTATRGSTVDLFAYTRPSTTYSVVRSGAVTSNGTVSWGIRPPRNTRLYAQQRGCLAGGSVVVGVRTTLSLAAVRNGVRNYTFYGDSLPARPGGLIVSLYRINADGSEVLSSQARASATTGEWSVTRRFTGSGSFGFIVRTGQDLQNAPGASHVRPTAIF
jgi:adhesin/invasin